VLGAGGAPSTAVRVRGYDPQKNFESSDAKSCILMTTMLISGLSSKCISQQTTSMSKAISVTKFQLFCRVAPFVVGTKKNSQMVIMKHVNCVQHDIFSIINRDCKIHWIARTSA